MLYVNPPGNRQGDTSLMDRKLKSDSSENVKTLMEVLRANAGKIVERWAASTSQSSYIKAKDFDMPEEVRMDSLRAFFSALMAKADSPASKTAHERMMSEVRAEHSKSLSLGTIVKKQNLLREIMFDVVEEEMPDFPKTTAKLAIDAMIDKSVEEIIVMQEEYTEMQLSLTRCNQAVADPAFSPDQALSKFCKNAMDYFDVDFVALFEYLPVAKELQVQACSARGIALMKDSRVSVDSFPLANEAFTKKRTVVARTAPADPGGRQRLVGQIAFSMSVCTPLIADDRPDGLLVLGDSSRSTAMTADEIALFEDLASQVESVRRSSTAFEELSLRSRAQKALLETAASLQQEIESEEIYRIIWARLSEIVPSDEFAFYVFDWSKRTASPAYASGPYASEIMADRDFPAETGFVGYVARSKKAEIILDSENDPRGSYIPDTPNAHTRMLAVPVIGQKEVIGVLELSRYPPDTFSPEDLEIASLFANHAAVALENARLLKEVVGVKDQAEVAMDLLTHDIANHTTPMMAYLETLKDRSSMDPTVSAVLERLGTQLDSMSLLVQMVRTLGKLRMPGPKELRPLDLNVAVGQALEEIRHFAGDKILGFSIALPTYKMLVMADDMFRDLFVNLFLSTVLSEHKENINVSVTAEPRKERKIDYWLIKVSQPNKKIPDSLKSEVLRMSKTSRSELTGGFGIGLAVAKVVVDRYSGNMWVSDIVPGDYTKGSVFNILLPKA